MVQCHLSCKAGNPYMKIKVTQEKAKKEKANCNFNTLQFTFFTQSFYYSLLYVKYYLMTAAENTCSW